ncbi:MAG: type II toxin-antitoxin system VapC family toxin [Fimbriimonadia bacterium]|nr:type II toxin-antitoxin system VapC family toxin [Fimbriimonadia bacterium]
MATNLDDSAKAIVVDANVIIAIASKETGRHHIAQTELTRYAQLGYVLYTPGVAIAETLYVLCQKQQKGLLTPVEYSQAIQDFEYLMQVILPSPQGDRYLIASGEQIRKGYGCSRSADSLYLALASQLLSKVSGKVAYV